MPIYDFHCTNCNTSFEKMTSIDNRDKVSCVHCEFKPVPRRVSACNHNVMKGTDSDIERTITEHKDVCKDEKLRVKHALKGLTPGKEDTQCGPKGCIHHTIAELTDRYGDII
ncbi:MAG: zinc ribbon domain-containing protein [Candidatus Cloacimonetes bacterium]|nr:zinc ribbon domain-containing protein [Candidatus Cloacimonadota bacterium]